MKGKIIKLLEYNTEEYLHALEIGKDFLSKIQKHHHKGKEQCVGLLKLKLELLFIKRHH